MKKLALVFCVGIVCKTWSLAAPINFGTDALYQTKAPAQAGKTSQPQRKRNKTPLRKPDVIYYPTPNETVIAMLSLANIKPGDVLYDLGSGDGRIPIMAAQVHGIRAVGIEIDPKLIPVAKEAARQAGVTSLVQFRNEDMFRTNISEASVVTLYLSERLNRLLRPKLLRELRPGARVISHDFLMGDWKPEQTIKVPWKADLYRTIYLWTIPRRGDTGTRGHGDMGR
jgi:predicted O-methyltransferase YrrM